ncbi:hypothetical protein F4680DRAFT_80135 [Xylaria scruposa]|nr:hypothetical protein F4680DRAFT_80135 [Xylaria scruposa]
MADAWLPRNIGLWIPTWLPSTLGKPRLDLTGLIRLLGADSLLSGVSLFTFFPFYIRPWWPESADHSLRSARSNVIDINIPRVDSTPGCKCKEAQVYRSRGDIQQYEVVCLWICCFQGLLR